MGHGKTMSHVCGEYLLATDGQPLVQRENKARDGHDLAPLARLIVAQTNGPARVSAAAVADGSRLTCSRRQPPHARGPFKSGEPLGHERFDATVCLSSVLEPGQGCATGVEPIDRLTVAQQHQHTRPTTSGLLRSPLPQRTRSRALNQCKRKKNNGLVSVCLLAATC